MAGRYNTKVSVLLESINQKLCTTWLVLTVLYFFSLSVNMVLTSLSRKLEQSLFVFTGTKLRGAVVELWITTRSSAKRICYSWPKFFCLKSTAKWNNGATNADIFCIWNNIKCVLRENFQLKVNNKWKSILDILTAIIFIDLIRQKEVHFYMFRDV